MKRTNIYLDDEQLRALDDRASGEGISRAELIRRMIDRALDGDGDRSTRRRAFEHALDATFGILKGDPDYQPARWEPDDERTRYLDELWRS
jgi:hypothetical protein